MKKLSKEQVKQRISDFMTDMEWAFDYQNFDRTVIFKKEDHETESCACSVVNDWKYRRVTITIFPCFFDADLKIQRGYLLHEFCHTFTDKLHETLEDMLKGKLYTADQVTGTNEEATSRITQVIGALLEGRMKYARTGYAKYIEVKKPKKRKVKR